MFYYNQVPTQGCMSILLKHVDLGIQAGSYTSRFIIFQYQCYLQFNIAVVFRGKMLFLLQKYA